MIINSQVFGHFLGKKYTLISKIQGVESIYYKENKVAVLIEDEKLGCHIYDMVKFLKGRKLRSISDNTLFNVTRIITGRHNRVHAFFIDTDVLVEKYVYTKMDRLRGLAGLVLSLCREGYYFDDVANMKIKDCNSLSYVLSHFRKNGRENEDDTVKFFIRYVHYVLSNGGKLENFYLGVEKSQIPYSMTDFPYNSISVINMCYNCFLGKPKVNLLLEFAQGEVDNILVEGKPYSIICKDTAKSRFSSLEENEYFITYEGNFRIFNYMPVDVSNILKAYAPYVIKRNPINPYVREKIRFLIADTNGTVIGYQFANEDSEERGYLISEMRFSNVTEIFCFIYQLYQFCKKNNGEQSKDVTDINLQLVRCYYGNQADAEFTFKVDTFFEYYKLINTDIEVLKRQLTNILFKVFSDYVTEKYGKITTKEGFLSIEEIKYINPIFMQEFIYHELKNVESKEESESSNIIDKLLESKDIFKNIYNMDSDNGYLIDVGGKDFKFLFLFEAEKKYNFRYNGGRYTKYVQGPSGLVQKIVFFDKPRSVKDFREEYTKKEYGLFWFIGGCRPADMIEWTEIIYSTELNSDGMYKFIGFVTSEFRGEYLTLENLLSYSNKDIFRIAGAMWNKLRWIPDECILYDRETPRLYIDIFCDSFKIFASDPVLEDPEPWKYRKYCKFCEVFGLTEETPNPKLLKSKFQKLVDNGYYKEALSYFDVNWKIEYLKELDAYCEEHNTYYRSSEGECPVCKAWKKYWKSRINKYL